MDLFSASPFHYTATMVLRAIKLFPRLWCLVCTLSLVVSTMNALALPELDAMREKGDAYLASLESDLATKRADWESDYRNALEGFIQQMQQEGNLEVLLLAKEELSRFEKMPVLGSAHVSEAPAALGAMLARLANRHDEDTRLHNRSVLALFDRFEDGLEKLESSLTTGGELDAAIAVRDARREVKKNPAIQRARFVLAALDYDAGQFVTSVPETADDTLIPELEDPPPVRSDEAAPLPAKSTIRGVDIYTVASPSRRAGVVQKRMPLFRSDASPLRAEWNASATSASTEKADRERYYVAKESSLHLQLSVRAPLSNKGLSSVIVVVDFCSKRADDYSGDKPKIASTRRTRVSLFPGKALLMAYPDFDLWMARSKTGSVYGDVLYGVVVTLFDENEKILYQCTSFRETKNLPRAEAPSQDENADALEAARDSLSAYMKRFSKKDWNSMALRHAVWMRANLAIRIERLALNGDD